MPWHGHILPWPWPWRGHAVAMAMPWPRHAMAMPWTFVKWLDQPHHHRDPQFVREDLANIWHDSLGALSQHCAPSGCASNAVTGGSLRLAMLEDITKQVLSEDSDILRLLDPARDPQAKDRWAHITSTYDAGDPRLRNSHDSISSAFYAMPWPWHGVAMARLCTGEPSRDLCPGKGDMYHSAKVAFRVDETLVWNNPPNPPDPANPLQSRQNSVENRRPGPPFHVRQGSG